MRFCNSGEARAQVETARLKFGNETADLLAWVLRGKSGPKRAAEKVRLLFECEAGKELVAKINRDRADGLRSNAGQEIVLF